MQAPVTTLVSEFAWQARLPQATGLDDDTDGAWWPNLRPIPRRSSGTCAASSKRVPEHFLQAARRVLKEYSEDLGRRNSRIYCGRARTCLPRWSIHIGCCSEPRLRLPSSRSGGNRCWISSLNIGFPSESSAVSEPDIARARRELALVGITRRATYSFASGEFAAQPAHAGALDRHGPLRPRQQQPGMGSQAVGRGGPQRACTRRD
jgi:hypothetical protein